MRGCEENKGGVGSFVGVAEDVEPVDARFFAEPGELALREIACGLLDFGDGFRERERAFKMGAELRIADEFERLCIVGDAGGDESADFVEPAGREHLVDAVVDAGVELLTRRIQPNFGDGVAFERGSAAAVNFADGLAREEAHFERANDFLRVGRGDARGGGRVEALQ